MRDQRDLACWLLAVLAGSWCAAAEPAGNDAADFAHVRPIFERRCVHCHQGDSPKGELDLTTAASARRGGESGAAIVPGKPAESLLLDYVAGEEPLMPKNGDPLTPDEVALLTRWIAQGALWPPEVKLTDQRFAGETWWAFEPLRDPPVPAVSSPWIRGPIDAFLLARLHEEGLSPSPVANRRTLIRRATYDLHGLPPTYEEIEAFVRDPAPDAYERLIDRLLASPRYGERWARHWLDVVHFGESHGYDKDKPRPNAWPYRDYVIRSLNADKPYVRFVQEQVAGDVLFPGDPDGVIATGFLAAGPWDFVGHVELREGTVDKDITRVNDRDDMIMTTMSTFLSLTVHCARCHDHKFDPITQKDYYRLQAVFAGIDRADRPYDDPQTARRRAELAGRLKQQQSALQAIEDRIAQCAGPQLRELDTRTAAAQEAVERLQQEVAAQSGGSLGYHSSIMPTPEHVKWVQVDLGQPRQIDRVVLWPSHVRYGGHPGPGFGFPPRFRVEASDEPDFARPVSLADSTDRDFPHPGDLPYVIDVNPQQPVRARYVRITATRLWERTKDYIFALSELLVFSGGENVALGSAVTSLDSIEAPPGWARRNLVDGSAHRWRLEATLGPDTPAAALLDHARQLHRAAAQREELLQSLVPEDLKRQRAEAAQQVLATEQALASLPKPKMVYAAAAQFAPQGNFRPAGSPRPVWLLNRGDVRSRGEPMSPGGLACLAELDEHFALPAGREQDEGQRRAALAAWLTDPRNMLLPRSIVNRVWQYHFGRGIVDTPNDFGRMGSRPTHPALLDWLACRFLEQGGSLRWLHRTIMTSAAYRQQSRHDADKARVDAGNRFLWRMHRARLDAESLRDSVLYVSGQLDPRMGGPSDPHYFFKDDHSPVYDYTQFDVDSPLAKRRSIYRKIIRSVPDPFMECLDCADPSILTPRRNVTVTALQALALWNNPFMVRHAEHLAEKIRRQAQSPDEQVVELFRRALGRMPGEEERVLLSAYLARHGLPAACRLILNSNEFAFVD